MSNWNESVLRTYRYHYPSQLLLAAGSAVLWTVEAGHDRSKVSKPFTLGNRNRSVSNFADY